MTILVTGGAGFIGANFVLDWLKRDDETIVNLDKLTYAGNLASLSAVADDPRHVFVKGDVCDADLVSSIMREYQPRAIVHLAAETHVDRSIHAPDSFVRTNVFGTFRLLEAARDFHSRLNAAERQGFRLINVSTDEVYGSLGLDAAPCKEASALAPSSPYAASKAAAEHLARSYLHTFGLPVITMRSSNNYGPYQFPEKLMPLTIVNGLRGELLPVYGDGQQVRDWLHVEDHCRALRAVLARGRPGETYNVGSSVETTNLDVIEGIIGLLDELAPSETSESRTGLIEFVEDRPGHDRRYAIDTHKIRRELGWRPGDTLAAGLRKTVEWYLGNGAWIDQVTNGDYRQWLDTNYKRRARVE